jgi:regulatory protein
LFTAQLQNTNPAAMLQSCPMPEGSRRERKRLDATALRDYALKALGGRALSLGELRQRLVRRAERPEDVQSVIDQLKEYGYVDDARFAESFATARRDSQGQGKMRVIRDLRARRVAPKVAEDAAAEAYAGVDESKMIEDYLKRKFRSVNLPEYLKEPKNLASAFRRLRYAGFAPGNIIRVLKRYSQQADELEDSSGTDE